MVNKDGTIQANATIAGQFYEVSCTERGTDNSVWSARDTIVNRNTGRKVTKTRREWKIWWDKFNKITKK